MRVFIGIVVSALLQDEGGFMFKIRLTDKTENRDGEYYLTGLELKSGVCDYEIGDI